MVIKNFCKQNKPDTVINSAAFTNVDACETEKDLAWMVNAWGCRNLALACSTVGSRLISISTDYVFEGGVKYAWMKEYYPREYELMKAFVLVLVYLF